MNTIKTFKQLSDEIAKLNCKDLEINLGKKTKCGDIRNSIKIRLKFNWLEISGFKDMNEEDSLASLYLFEDESTIHRITIAIKEDLQLIFNAVKLLIALGGKKE